MTFGMIDLGLEILKLLGVAGGGAVGWLSGGWLTNRATKLAVKKPPVAVQRSGKAASGIGLAYLVWLWVYGAGGGGWGFGGGPGVGPGTGQTSNGHGEQEYVTTTAEKKAAEPAGKPAVPRTTSARIVLLGGSRVRDQRYYLLEGDMEPKTLQSIKDALTPQMQPGADPILKSLVIVIYEDSVAVEHAAVRELERWARQQDLNVEIQKPAGSRPQ